MTSSTCQAFYVVGSLRLVPVTPRRHALLRPPGYFALKQGGRHEMQTFDFLFINIAPKEIPKPRTSQGWAASPMQYG